jgi:hypothetical protein
VPKGFRDMKRELENRQQQGESNQSKWNLSPETLEAYTENQRKVDAGLLPKYIGGSAGTLSDPEVETQAKLVYEFSHLINPKRRLNR